MDSFFGTLLFAGVIYWFYRLGKSTGSRKGFNVGFSRGRHKSRQQHRNLR